MAAMSRPARTEKVLDALADLPAAVEAARNAEKSGADEATVLALWEAVEMLGAIVHRQSRILAGKSRGG